MDEARGIPERKSVSRSGLLTVLAPILGIVILAGGFRFYLVERTYPVRLRGDEVYYLTLGREIAAGHGHVHPGPSHDHARRPPAFPWLLSRFVGWGGADPRHDWLRPEKELLYVQAALGTLLVLLTCLLGRALFDEKTGILAGAFAAADPTLVAFSHYLWSETLFTVLITGGLLGVVYGVRTRSSVLAAATGIAFGAATLTREIALPVAVVCVAWQICQAQPASRRAAAGRGLLTLLLASLVVLPWTWRNYTVFHRLVPVSTIGWFAAAEGNTFDEKDWFRNLPDYSDFRAAYKDAGDEMSRSEFARTYTRDHIRAEQPAWIVKKLLRNTALLLSPDSYLLLKIREGLYGPVSLAWKRFLEASTILTLIFVFTLGVVGIAAADRAGARVLPCLVLGVVVAVHVYANAVSRFRVPWMPLLMVYASHAAFDLPHSVRRLSWRGWAAAGSILIYFFAVCLPYHGNMLAQMWNGEGQDPRGPIQETGTDPGGG